MPDEGRMAVTNFDLFYPRNRLIRMSFSWDQVVGNAKKVLEHTSTYSHRSKRLTFSDKETMHCKTLCTSSKPESSCSCV